MLVTDIEKRQVEEKIRIPNFVPVRWDKMIDIPTIPPSMILLGTRNNSSPTAASMAPMAISTALFSNLTLDIIFPLLQV